MVSMRSIMGDIYLLEHVRKYLDAPTFSRKLARLPSTNNLTPIFLLIFWIPFYNNGNYLHCQSITASYCIWTVILVSLKIQCIDSHMYTNKHKLILQGPYALLMCMSFLRQIASNIYTSKYFTLLTCTVHSYLINIISSVVSKKSKYDKCKQPSEQKTY